jgi:hypothetical protein
MARVLFIVGHDHPGLLASLRQEFAAQEAAGLAEIFMDRREGPGQRGVEPQDFDDHRRDRRRNLDINSDLHGLGCAVVPRSEPTSGTG